MKWAAKFKGCNWGLSLSKSGLVAVDVDEKGINPWEALCFHHGEPQTLKAKSGSGIGAHYIFKAKPGIRYRGKIVKGIDVKHNGYVAIYPSVHPKTGLQYEWVNDAPPGDYEKWLADLFEKGEGVHGKSSPVYKFAGSEWYKKIIDQIKERDLDYDTWVRLGMALHSAFGGSDEGLSLYLDLSEGASYKEGDSETARSKWDSFKVQGKDGVGGGVSLGTFIYHARALGCSIPAPGFEEDKEAFSELDAGDPSSEEKWFENSYGHKYAYNAEFVVSEINKMGFAALTGAHLGRMVRHWTDAQGVEQFKMLLTEDFKNTLATYSLKTLGSNGHYKTIPASQIWLKSARKTSYREVVFEPYADFQDLNLWSDIPCEGLKGDISPIVELIELLCGGDSVKAAYVIEWLAHLVQKPGEKCVVVPVLIGEQGTGKGLFTDGVLYRILTGSFYVRLDKPGVIKERFNSEQARKFLTVLDESSWRGDYELVGLMKSLTGNATMTVEEKFGGRYTIANYSRYIITSNTIDAVKIETSNRRYLVLESSTAWKGTDRFKKLAAELKRGELHRAFYEHLMNVDLSGFDPFEFPAHLDNAGEDTKIESMGQAGQYIADILYGNPDEIFRPSKQIGTIVSKSELYEQFMNYNSRFKQWGKRYTSKAFTSELENLIPILKDREIVLRVGDKIHRAWQVSIYEFFMSFCARSRLVIPKDFDELEYLISEDFK
jgi:hypothetical protein